MQDQGPTVQKEVFRCLQLTGPVLAVGDHGQQGGEGTEPGQGRRLTKGGRPGKTGLLQSDPGRPGRFQPEKQQQEGLLILAGQFIRLQQDGDGLDHANLQHAQLIFTAFIRKIYQ